MHTGSLWSIIREANLVLLSEFNCYLRVDGFSLRVDDQCMTWRVERVAQETNLSSLGIWGSKAPARIDRPRLSSGHPQGRNDATLRLCSVQRKRDTLGMIS